MKKLSWALFVVVLLASLLVALPAYATDCMGERDVNNQCVTDPSPAVVPESPIPPPIDQSQGTGGDVQDVLVGDGYAGCTGTHTTAFGSNEVDEKACLEYRSHSGGVGNDLRLKVRFTFFTRDSNGIRHDAYGNVRWDVKWNNDTSSPNYTKPLYRRVYYSDGVTTPIVARTQSRSDAIAVHTTVGYSLWGCSGISGLYHWGTAKNHYVRLPNGALAGPFTISTASVVNTCLP